ncbi:olee1-like protein [Momordica charantia]|uniref:Olee1-like protein n=1 Tax=Momordica charantia TaxID=3673 RepID=A0A6J1CEW5_MOMCH|nr:olee1-like protein [Momordica charantia]
MAKCGVIALSFVCIFSLIISFVYCGEDRFFVEGKVYCDTCRAQFVTRVSEYMKGAQVKLECRNLESESLTYSNHATTDETGTYRLLVDGDHEEEACEVSLVKSSRADCDEMDKGAFAKPSAMVGLTQNNGLSKPVREASPLGFLKKTPLPECSEVLRELGFTRNGKLAD